jgi:hypothetical protein
MSEMEIGAVDEAESGALLDLEAPEADAIEQWVAVRGSESAPADHMPFDADEADAAEQLRIVELDEDDYR